MHASRKAAETPDSHYIFISQCIMITFLPYLLQKNIILAVRVNAQGQQQGQRLRLLCRGRYASIMQENPDIYGHISNRETTMEQAALPNIGPYLYPSITQRHRVYPPLYHHENHLGRIYYQTHTLCTDILYITYTTF